MSASRAERIVTVLLEIAGAGLAAGLVATHQAPGESWLAPAFMGLIAAVLVHQAREAGLLRLVRLTRLRLRRFIPAGFPRP
jgi:hypothetical protein